MTAIRIYSPEGSVGRAGTALAPVPEALAGRRILVLDNGKPGADWLMTRLAEQLATRTGADFVGVHRKRTWRIGKIASRNRRSENDRSTYSKDPWVEKQSLPKLIAVGKHEVIGDFESKSMSDLLG